MSEAKLIASWRSFLHLIPILRLQSTIGLFAVLSALVQAEKSETETASQSD